MKDQLEIFERLLNAPQLNHVNFDISWDETAKYIVATPDAVRATAALINRHPDRFLFGSDVVAPTSDKAQMAVYDAYAPLWAALTPEARKKVTTGNYERLFDQARTRVRAWEKAHAAVK